MHNYTQPYTCTLLQYKIIVRIAPCTIKHNHILVVRHLVQYLKEQYLLGVI